MGIDFGRGELVLFWFWLFSSFFFLQLTQPSPGMVGVQFLVRDARTFMWNI